MLGRILLIAREDCNSNTKQDSPHCVPFPKAFALVYIRVSHNFLRRLVYAQRCSENHTELEQRRHLKPARNIYLLFRLERIFSWRLEGPIENDEVLKRYCSPSISIPSTAFYLQLEVRSALAATGQFKQR